MTIADLAVSFLPDYNSGSVVENLKVPPISENFLLLVFQEGQKRGPRGKKHQV